MKMNLNATQALVDLTDIANLVSMTEELMLDGMETEFPIKDRTASRKHSASRRKAKEQNRSRKATAYQRSADLYNSGLDRAGRTFKVRSQSAYASLDEREALKGNENTIPVDTRDTADWADSIFATCRSIIDIQNVVNSLENKGIVVDTDIIKSANAKMWDKDVRKSKRDAIYRNRPILGYAVVGDYTAYTVGIYPTRELANEVFLDLLNDEEFKEIDLNVIPIYTFTPAQVRELKELGFQPIGTRKGGWYTDNPYFD